MREDNETIGQRVTMGQEGFVLEDDSRLERRAHMSLDTLSGQQTMDDNRRIVLAGRYRVVRRLGEGGMGSVWLAEDMKLDGRKVAIKMLPAVLAGKKGAYRQVKAEAMVVMKLSHPNIATVRAFEEDEDGNPFLVMDYIEGEPLDDILAERGPLSAEETLRILGPVAAALDYAHSKGVVHRDVKPGNVMVRKDGTPYVLDFGIAREIQETMTRVTGKLSSGTLLYMSPEQLDGDAPKTAQDVYSFAAMAYECLTGHPPFCRGGIEDQIKNKMPEELPSSVDERLRKGVMAGLAKQAEGRPRSCVGVLGCDVRRPAVAAHGRNQEWLGGVTSLQQEEQVGIAALDGAPEKTAARKLELRGERRLVNGRGTEDRTILLHIGERGEEEGNETRPKKRGGNGLWWGLMLLVGGFLLVWSAKLSWMRNGREKRPEEAPVELPISSDVLSFSTMSSNSSQQNSLADPMSGQEGETGTVRARVENVTPLQKKPKKIRQTNVLMRTSSPNTPVTKTNVVHKVFPQAPIPEEKTTLTPEQIQKLLAAGARPSDRTSIPKGTAEAELGAYLNEVKTRVDAAWKQPTGLASLGKLSCQAAIVVQPNGTVTDARLTMPSGNSTMDQSVKAALASVPALPRLPAGIKSARTITITFELQD